MALPSAEPVNPQLHHPDTTSMFPPGYADFLTNYQQIQALSPEAKGNFIMHDLASSITTPIIGILTYYDSRTQDKLYNKIVPEANSNPLKKIEYLEGALQVDFDHLPATDETFDAYAKDIVHRKVEPLRKCFPLLKASALFLDAPTPDKLEALQKIKVQAKDLAALYGVPVENVPEAFELEGGRAIMAVNLFSNAVRHADNPESIRMDLTNNGFEVSNGSVEPLPQSNVFALGVRGDNKGYGYGLFMAKHLYGPLAGVNIEATSSAKAPDASPKDPPFNIRFSVTPSR